MRWAKSAGRVTFFGLLALLPISFLILKHRPVPVDVQGCYQSPHAPSFILLGESLSFTGAGRTHSAQYISGNGGYVLELSPPISLKKVGRNYMVSPSGAPNDFSVSKGRLSTYSENGDLVEYFRVSCKVNVAEPSVTSS